MISASALVAAGGFLGALCRYSITKWVTKRWVTEIPVATLFINILGSFLLGILIGSNMDHSTVLFAGTGFMGAFTTFSTFILEAIQLHAKRNWNSLVRYLLFSYIGGLLFAFLGVTIGNLYI